MPLKRPRYNHDAGAHLSREEREAWQAYHDDQGSVCNLKDIQQRKNRSAAKGSGRRAGARRGPSFPRGGDVRVTGDELVAWRNYTDIQRKKTRSRTRKRLRKGERVEEQVGLGAQTFVVLPKLNG